MCNLYRLRVKRWEIIEHYRAIEDFRRDADLEKDYVAPGKPGMVVRLEDGQRIVDQMKWGFCTRKPRKRPAREGELPFLYDWWTNARNLGNSMWKPSLLKPAQRCLVPFTEFSEPKASGDRIGPGDLHWWFKVEDQTLPCFAGVWKHDDDHGPVYAFLTTEPNPLVAPKHPKAMPVILLADDHARWLSGSYDDVLSLQAGYPSQLMTVT